MLEDILPLAPLQEGLLFHAHRTRALDPYCVQVALIFDRDVDAPALKAAAGGLVARHAALRAAFRQDGLNLPVQTILREVPCPWETLRWDVSGAQLEEEWRHLLARERARRFDLGQPPLFRFVFVRTEGAACRLLMTFHHILMDGWSISLLVDDLLALYSSNGNASRLSDAPVLRHFMQWLARRDREAAIAAWRAELSAIDEPTRVAPDGDGGDVTAFPDRVTLAFPAALDERLRQRARDCGVTLNTLLQAAWSILLSRLTRQRDVVFGTAVAVRPSEVAGVARMVGMLMNTVPVVTRMRDDDTLRALCRRLHDHRLRLMAHDHLSLADIQRAAGHAALFDTLFVFENVTRANVTGAAGPRPHVDRVETCTFTHYPLTVLVMPAGPTVVHFDYRPDRFERAAVEAFAARLRLLVDQIVQTPDQDVPIGDLTVTSADEQRAIAQWTSGGTAPPARSPVERIAEQAALTPAAPAVTDRGARLTYTQLMHHARRLARVLVERGARPETAVGVALPRSTDAVVAALAVLDAGAVYVPLDPEYPCERLASIVEDASPTCVIVTGETRGRLPAGIEIVDLDAADVRRALACTQAIEPLPARVPRDEQAAYIIFTSGSTGRPKGVVVTYGALSNFLAAVSRTLPLGPDDRLLAVTTTSFDMSIFELLSPLCAGAQVIVTTTAELQDAAALRSLIDEHRPTVVQATPSYWEWIVSQELDCWRGVRAIAGGEALSIALARQLATAGAFVYNGYGPTEATVYTTVHAVSERDVDDDRAGGVSIGRPLAGYSVYVLDPHLQPVPCMVRGELYIAGVGIARGYHRRPALTADRFVPDPFGPPGSRMYRTGDLTRWRSDGSLEFAGRVDEQVKIRGFRVEPDEISAALLRLPHVAQAAVVLREDRPGERRLVAYVVADAGAAPSGSELRRMLEPRLPAHLIPAAIVVMPALPRTPNGKIDRKALPAPAMHAERSAREPRSGQESKFCAVCAEVLGVADVGLDDNFFDLGGHSLLAMRLSNRLQSVFGVTVPPDRVYETATLGELVAHLRAK